MTARTASAARGGLGFLAVAAVFVGAWAAVAPRSFYDHFPGLGRMWVSVDGPYNEHLVRDVGTLNLALAVVTVWAAVTLVRPLVTSVLVAWIVAGAPHFVYHATHVGGLGTGDRIGELASLALVPLVAASLLVVVLLATRPRRDDVVTLDDDMCRVVDAELGFVATVCPDGTPNLSPKGTVAVWDDHRLVFADLRSPGTVANLRSNPNVEVNVVDQLTRKGYRFKGVATVHVDDDDFARGLAFYEQRGTIDARRRIRGIVLVAVHRASPVTSPSYDIGLTESELRDRALRALNERAQRDPAV